MKIWWGAAGVHTVGRTQDVQTQQEGRFLGVSDRMKSTNADILIIIQTNTHIIDLNLHSGRKKNTLKKKTQKLVSSQTRNQWTHHWSQFSFHLREKAHCRPSRPLLLRPVLYRPVEQVCQTRGLQTKRDPSKPKCGRQQSFTHPENGSTFFCSFFIL